MPELIKTLERVRGSERELGLHETATRQGAVLPILAELGWNPYDLSEVVPEYGLAGRRVDYCLRLAGQNAVFVEVKRTTEKLVGHQRQLLEYAFEQGVPLAALTNGLQWWLYLPTESGPWEERKFLSIDLREQSADQVAASFTKFLGRDVIALGSALVDARSLRESHKRTQVIADALPRAWERLLSEPDDLLIEILMERTESMCAYRPDTESVVAFLRLNLRVSAPTAVATSRHEFSTRTPLTPGYPTRRTPAVVGAGNYTGSKPSSISLFGQEHYVDTWVAVLIVVCAAARDLAPERFEQVLSLRGSLRIYFSRQPRDLVMPRLIPGSDIYAATSMSASAIVQRCYEVLQKVGASPDSLLIRT